MHVLLLVISAILFFVGLYLIYTRHNGYWKKYGVPHEEPEFFFGNLGDALTGKLPMGLIHAKFYKKYSLFPFVGFFELREPAIIVRDLDVIKDILVNESDKFANTAFRINPITEPVFTDHPYNLTGEDWKAKRAEWMNGLTFNKIKSMFDVVVIKGDIAMKEIHQLVTSNSEEPVDVRDMAFKYLTDIIVESVLGIQINSFDDPSNEFIRITRTLHSFDLQSDIQTLVHFTCPWLNKIIGTGLVNRKVKRQLLEIAKHIIEIRKKNGFLENDLFESLMTKEKVSKMEIAARVFGFLSEGVETSSSLITFILFELSVNPEVQTKLRQDIMKSIVENNGNLSYEAMHSLPYLDQIINETLRIHPSTFSISRICNEFYELPPVIPQHYPYTIPVGMSVIIPLYAVGMDPQYFKNPETFHPERFSKERIEQISDCSFLPFGNGPRSCVGQNLALTNVKSFIINVITNFEVRLSPKTKAPLEVDPNSIGNRAVGDIWLTFHLDSRK